MKIKAYMDIGQPKIVKYIGYLSFFLLRIQSSFLFQANPCCVSPSKIQSFISHYGSQREPVRSALSLPPMPGNGVMAQQITCTCPGL